MNCCRWISPGCGAWKNDRYRGRFFLLGYICRRLLAVIPTMLLVAVVVFVVLRVIPGDPTNMLVGDLVNQALNNQVRSDLGLDQPIPVQLMRWLSQLAHGDLGVSIMTGEPVLEALLGRFAVTARIVCMAVLLSALIAIPVGMLAAWRQNSLTDTFITLSLVLCLSVPSFWIALLLLLHFGVELGWLPTVGVAPAGAGFKELLRYSTLPVLSLVIVEMAVLARMVRASTIEVMREEYVMHARAKGLSEAAVMVHHVFRNAFTPALTLLGLILASLLGGAVVIETVFSIPGLGRLLIDAINARDYPVIQGTLLLVAAIYVVVNLIVDLFYPWFDPRVKP